MNFHASNQKINMFTNTKEVDLYDLTYDQYPSFF